MHTINEDTMADLWMGIRWESAEATHSENYHAGNVNFYRDYLPDGLLQKLMGKSAGDTVELSLGKGELVTESDPRNRFDIKRSQFGDHTVGAGDIPPRVGRFYPKGILRNVPGVFRQNVQPFRCVGVQNGHVAVDFNHPLSDRSIQFHALVEAVRPKDEERGGTANHWLETISDGPGMQVRWHQHPTDFEPEHLPQRADESPDRIFYEKPRIVQHIDDRAIDVIKGIHACHLNNGMRVLDLMSSWQSHIPDGIELERLVGLGMNNSELKHNRELTERRVHDLNENPILPFESEQFDAVLCTVSIEYLTDPVAITREVSRVLKPGGPFVVTFSNRWFPTKAVNIWERLHDFERMGLVMDHFIRSESFVDLGTYSMRGLPRPIHDKYYAELIHSDPVYAVWGQKK